MDFKLYTTERPTVAGIYVWRAPSKVLSGLTVAWVDELSYRGAGHTDVLSPAFGYWDGYRVHVPKGLEWDVAPADVARHSSARCKYILDVTGAEPLEPCPFCERTPKWVFNAESVLGRPFEHGRWTRPSCCRWIGEQSRHDPRDIAPAWNAAVRPLNEAKQRLNLIDLPPLPRC